MPIAEREGTRAAEGYLVGLGIRVGGAPDTMIPRRLPRTAGRRCTVSFTGGGGDPTGGAALVLESAFTNQGECLVGKGGSGCHRNVPDQGRQGYYANGTTMNSQSRLIAASANRKWRRAHLAVREEAD